MLEELRPKAGSLVSTIHPEPAQIPVRIGRMSAIHLLEDGERIRVLLCRNGFAQGGNDRVSVRLGIRRKPHRHGRKIGQPPHRLALERLTTEGSDECREVPQVCQRFGEEPSLDRISDERRHQRREDLGLIRLANRL